MKYYMLFYKGMTALGALIPEVMHYSYSYQELCLLYLLHFLNIL